MLTKFAGHRGRPVNAGLIFINGVNTGMRLTTKFSAFVTLLTGLTIFVTLIGCSLSFYNGIQSKVDYRARAVATVIDSRLVNTPFNSTRQPAG